MGVWHGMFVREMIKVRYGWSSDADQEQCFILGNISLRMKGFQLSQVLFLKLN